MNMRRLAELPLFQGLDEDALRAVASAVTEESVEAGRILVREGDFSQDLTIIDEGSARVEHAGQELATLSDISAYEILTGLRQRLPRRYVESGAPETAA